ncbi:2-hydroxychromene-2-carboxylate isomerase [Chachezhania antarctica]|uniref:2-hydroxychromene-2-carboxylate isomerase n=1 Tax=Chachezhania antarctica TaxID=2340860 RepID=UPI000EAF5781|nr:2-hydroxychromene-2-carboxylate isomerase [Chachezhania antarctica]
MTEIEFYYDFGSPYSHMAYHVLPVITERTGAQVVNRPMLIGGVFKLTGNTSPIEKDAHLASKIVYRWHELQRYAGRHGITHNQNPHFPINTLPLMRGAIYAQGKPWEADYTAAMWAAIWRDGKKMDDPSAIGEALAAAGLPVDEIVTAVQDPAVKQGLIDATEAAVARGVFGAPIMFVGDEMFFGKDSLTELEYFVEHGA